MEDYKAGIGELFMDNIVMPLIVGSVLVLYTIRNFFKKVNV